MGVRESACHRTPVAVAAEHHDDGEAYKRHDIGQLHVATGSIGNQPLNQRNDATADDAHNENGAADGRVLPEPFDGQPVNRRPCRTKEDADRDCCVNCGNVGYRR